MSKDAKAKIIAVVVFLVAFVNLNFAAASDSPQTYWTVEEYHKLFPDQVKLTESFDQVIQQKGKKQTSISKPVKIIMVLPGLQVSDYWRRSIISMEKRLQERGIPYELKTHFTKPGDMFREQSKKLIEFLRGDPDYVVFTLNADQHRSLIGQLIRKPGLKVVLQNITTPFKAFGVNQPFQYVGFDHRIGTEQLAKKYLKRFGGNAKFAIMYGERGYVSEMRCGTFADLMNKHPGMKQVSTYHVGFNREKSYLATKDAIIANPDIDFIFSCSTDIAFGVIDAVKELGKSDQIITNGWGGGASELEAIEKKELAFTIMRMNDDNGVAMAEAILLDSMGKGEQVPLIYSGSMVIVDQETGQNSILDLKKRAFRYSD